MDVNFLHDSKAFSAIISILPPSTTDSRSLHSSKAYAPIVVTESGRMSDFI